MTEVDFIETCMARLVVSGTTPGDYAARTLMLAQALWRARAKPIRHGSPFTIDNLDEYEQEFIDCVAITQACNVVNFVSSELQIQHEAEKRYQIAIKRWETVRNWRQQYDADANSKIGVAEAVPE